MRCAVVRDGVVVNVVMASPAEDKLEGATVVASDTASIGDSYDGAVFTLPAPVYPPLAEVILARKREVDALLSARVAMVSVSGVPAPVQMRDNEDDRANIDSQALAATLTKLDPTGPVQWAPDEAWRLADNSSFPLPTADAMIVFAAAAGAAYKALRKVGWAHKDALGKLTTAEDVAAYDITVGW